VSVSLAEVSVHEEDEVAVVLLVAEVVTAFLLEVGARLLVDASGLRARPR
jgi:hypothetical protein